ncbi:MAG: hypothetical protein HOV87_30235 [Catenulispora sp.]|nr:hypothetical protein [Catenulispora sp.]
MGAGSWANDQTPGTQAHLYGSSYSYWTPAADPPLLYVDFDYDFYPVDHIRPC